MSFVIATFSDGHKAVLPRAWVYDPKIQLNKKHMAFYHKDTKKNAPTDFSRLSLCEFGKRRSGALHSVYISGQAANLAEAIEMTQKRTVVKPKHIQTDTDDVVKILSPKNKRKKRMKLQQKITATNENEKHLTAFVDKPSVPTKCKGEQPDPSVSRHSREENPKMTFFSKKSRFVSTTPDICKSNNVQNFEIDSLNIPKNNSPKNNSNLPFEGNNDLTPPLANIASSSPESCVIPQTPKARQFKNRISKGCVHDSIDLDINHTSQTPKRLSGANICPQCQTLKNKLTHAENRLRILTELNYKLQVENMKHAAGGTNVVPFLNRVADFIAPQITEQINSDCIPGVEGDGRFIASLADKLWTKQELKLRSVKGKPCYLHPNVGHQIPATPAKIAFITEKLFQRIDLDGDIDAVRRIPARVTRKLNEKMSNLRRNKI